jgi:ATP-dependent protease HslVU (ClpYQ) peptidase subunit
MTCIIAHRDGWMVADRRASFDGWVGPYKVEKIFRCAQLPILVGVSGTAGVKTLMQEATEGCRIHSDAIRAMVQVQRDRKTEDGTTLLVLSAQGLLEIDPSGYAYELESNIWAVGSGSMTAIAYLAGWSADWPHRKVSGTTAEAAIKFVGTLNTTVGDGIQAEYLTPP